MAKANTLKLLTFRTHYFFGIKFVYFHSTNFYNLSQLIEISYLSNLIYFLIYCKKMSVNCWPDLAVNFKENFEAFLQQKFFSDVTLIAQNRNGVDVKFPVHRFVLASAIPYVCLLI